MIRRTCHHLSRTLRPHPLHRSFTAASATKPIDPTAPAPAPQEPLSPLGAFLRRQILFSGPIPVPQYTSLCLTHPSHGYYTSRRTIFGASGDFVTAPEVSQVFGEALAIWVASVARQLPGARFALAELGPGNGTLMTDVLRALAAFKCLPAAVHFVEASTPLRNVQKEAVQPVAGSHGISLRWHAALANVPDAALRSGADPPTIYLAQEFFDALPVHVFRRSDKGTWGEQLVDVVRGDELRKENEAPGLHFRYVVSPGATPATAVFKGRFLEGENESVVEVCADGIALAEELATRVKKSGGAALVVDYGHDMGAGKAGPACSVRAIREHGVVDVLSQPGMADVTADVNFAHLRAAVGEGRGAKFCGSVEQGQFLLRLGAAARFRKLGMEIVNDESLSAKVADERLDGLQKDHDRLLLGEGMGTIYRAAAIAHADLDIPALDLP